MKEVFYQSEYCVVHCDNCGDVLEVCSRDYFEINEDMKLEGWINRNIDGDWHEFCSTKCFRDFKYGK